VRGDISAVDIFLNAVCFDFPRGIIAILFVSLPSVSTVSVPVFIQLVFSVLPEMDYFVC
jgi:hypothetical protein